MGAEEVKEFGHKSRDKKFRKEERSGDYDHYKRKHSRDKFKYSRHSRDDRYNEGSD